MTKDSTGILIVSQNKKAFHNYEVLDKIEAGLVLKGSEVKSIRAAEVNLKESYVKLINNEAFLIACHINPYIFSPVNAHEPTRDKKLLLNSKELTKLKVQIAQKGLTIVPLKIYFKMGRAKLEIGVARGKKSHDKREDIKKRDIERQLKKAASIRVRK